MFSFKNIQFDVKFKNFTDKTISKEIGGYNLYKEYIIFFYNRPT